MRRCVRQCTTYTPCVGLGSLLRRTPWEGGLGKFHVGEITSIFGLLGSSGGSFLARGRHGWPRVWMG